MSNKTDNIKTFKTFRDLKTIPNQIERTSSSITSTSSITSKPRISRTPSNTSRAKNKEISPTSDFQKIPNSVTRDALPQGTFKGKSKHVYDYLWSVSRGAIQPTRIVKKSRREIKQGAGLGSMVTVDAAIEHLERIGLIKVTASVGSLAGNQYEIFAPDEIDVGYTSISSISSISSLTQKVDILDNPENSISRTTQTIEDTAIYKDAKTIFKTLKQDDDDSPLAQSLRSLNEAAKRTTGKDLGKKDFEAFGEIVELIIAETDLARTRTHSVSVYLKLAAENLRRRLYSRPKQTKGKSEKNVNWSTVGKFEEGMEQKEVEEYSPEPLTEETRQNALVIIRGMLRNDTLEGIQSLADHYVAKDWDWLMEQLKKGNV